MILGLEEEEENIKQNEKDKYNLESVTKYNEKSYAPIIKKELTIIPESDISREDSIFNEDNLLSTKKQNNKDLEEDDSGFILNKKSSSGIRLNLKKPKKESNNINNENKNKEIDLDNNNEGNEILLNDDNNNINENEDLEDNGQVRLRGKQNLYRSRSRYCLDYLDKNVNINQPNIDNSIFGTIFYTICLSEFGDRTQLISLTASSIFHFFGSILGSCLALFCSCLIGVYFSRKVMKMFKQKIIDFVLGSIFLGFGIQIYISKRQSQAVV